MRKLLRFLSDEEGPTAVEYAVMLALILGVVFGTIMFLGFQAQESFENSRDLINASTGGS